MALSAVDDIGEDPEQRPWEEPDGPEAWERMPGEGPKPYAALVAYREMGPNDRSTRGLARQLAKSGSLVRQWSVRWWWQERCALHDADVYSRVRQAQVEELAAMAVRQARLGVAAQGKVAEWLMNLDPSTLTATTATRLLEVSSKLERVARGEATEIARTTSEIAVTARDPFDGELPPIEQLIAIREHLDRQAAAIRNDPA